MLPASVNGNRCNELIDTFRQHKGINYVPSTVHTSIRWSKMDPMLDPIADNLPWNIVTQKSTHNSSSNIEISYNTPLTTLNNKKRKGVTSEIEQRSKTIKTNSETKRNNNNINIDVQSLAPIGTSWHQNSCAYDAVLCIVHSIWSSDKNLYTDIFRRMNNILDNLVSNFIEMASGTKTLDSARDNTRHYLHQLAPYHFRWGQFTSASKLTEYLLTIPTAAIQNDFICSNGHISRTRRTNNTCCLLGIGSTMCRSIANWIHVMKEESNSNCTICTEKMAITHQFLLPLPFIAIDFSSQQLQIDYTFCIYINNERHIYELQGIVYYGDSHFTARIISNNGMIWFHDGIATCQSLEYESTFQNFHGSLKSCKGKEAIIVFYVKLY